MTVLLIVIAVLQCASILLHLFKAPVAVDQIVDGVLAALEGQSAAAPAVKQ